MAKAITSDFLALKPNEVVKKRLENVVSRIYGKYN
jgi:hypothetical protein